MCGVALGYHFSCVTEIIYRFFYKKKNNYGCGKSSVNMMVLRTISAYLKKSWVQ